VSSPAAWHPDPSGEHDHRYWDGQRWTEHVADAGVASTDPLPDVPPADASDRPASDTPERTEQPASETPERTEQPASDTPQRTEQPAWGSQARDDQPVWGGHASSPGPWGGTGGTGAVPPPSGMATASLVTGVLSLPLLIFFGLGAIAGIVAVVLGIVAVRRVGRGQASGRGLAIGGIVTGAISVLLGVLIFLALVAFGFGFAGEFERCLEETGSQQVCQERLERELTERFLER
jgi:hypothetical protein